ncbi:MAG: BlaI/MecI/CopY family transcriptional regulator [Verrucomicrobiales bacterium]
MNRKSNSQASLPKPTEAELELLQIFWQRGPSTVREIHETLSGDKGTGYTTTLKILQKMAEKGLVHRDESERSHIYRPVMRAEQTQRQLVRDLLQKAFGGSPGRLVVAALSEKKATAAEMAEIRRLLNQMEGNPQPESDDAS